MSIGAPRVKVRLDVEVELDEGDGGAGPEQIGNELTNTLMHVAPYVMTEGERWHVASVGFEADPITCWYIGPESRIYHTNRLCTALNRDNRYWPIHGATQPPLDRSLCRLCAKELD